MAGNAVPRVGAGRPPDPNALRRDRPGDAATWTRLPSGGRGEPAPEWPLSRPTAPEARLWARLWAMPQAVMWERNRQELEVARHVRDSIQAQSRSSATPLRVLVHRQAESLGMTSLGLRALRWVIEPAAVAPAAQDAPAAVTDIRDRLRRLDEET